MNRKNSQLYHSINEPWEIPEIYKEFSLEAPNGSFLTFSKITNSSHEFIVEWYEEKNVRILKGKIVAHKNINGDVSWIYSLKNVLPEVLPWLM